MTEDLTEWPKVEATIHAATAGEVRPNRVLAERLAVMHRMAYRLRAFHQQMPPQLSPEEKLLKAIFGERAEVQVELVEAGARIARGTPLIVHPQGRIVFEAGDAADVEAVERKTEGLPEDVAEDIIVTVRWPGPLTVGDALAIGGRTLGIVDGLVDDGASEPRLYLAQPVAAGAIERTTPTAAQSLQARSIGPYSTPSQRPLYGEVLRDDQVMWLAEHDGRALIGDASVYWLADPVLRTRVYEQLVKLEPIPDAWSATGPAPAPPGKDIFNFFEKPTRPIAAVKVADAHARACGLAITLAGHELELALRMPGDPAAWSHGEVTLDATLDFDTGAPVPDGLCCQRLFGPVTDYECECGKYKRMKHRGVVCEKCGVTVTQSAVRGEWFAHIALATPCVPRHLRPLADALLGGRLDELLDLGEPVREALAAVDVAAMPSFAASGVAPAELAWTVLPVLPPALRPIVALAGGRWATADVNDLYRDVVYRNKRLRRLIELGADPVVLENERRMLRRAVDTLLDNAGDAKPSCDQKGRQLFGMFDLLRSALVPSRPRRCDYAASGIALVADGPCKLPLSVLAELLAPLLYGIVEQRGYASTIKGAKRLLATDERVRREAVGMAIAHRAVVFGAADPQLVGSRVEIGEDPVFALSPEVAGALGVRTGDRVTVHVPISDAAQREAHALGARATPVEATGWLREVFDQPASRFVDRAVLRAKDPCSWPFAALFVGGYELAGPPAPPIPLGPPLPDERKPPSDLDRALTELELTVGTASILEAAKLVTIRDLLARTEADVLKLGGRRVLKEVKDALGALGLRLGS